MLPVWVRRNPLLRVWFFIVFILAGLVINVLQILSAIAVWPINKTAYRRLNATLVECHWTMLFFMIQYWSTITLRL